MTHSPADHTKSAFCRAYLRSMRLDAAERSAGVSDGCDLLRAKSVQKELGRRRKAAANIEREDILRRLCEIAFSPANDAVKLAFLENPKPSAIDSLDLSAVSEIKRAANGAFEIRFADRIKALDLLYNILCSHSDTEEAEDFFRALEQSGDCP